MAAWLSQPVQLHSSRVFDCEGFTDEECSYYRHLWHFWYQADHVFGLSTVAFFMTAIGMFIIGHFISQVFAHRRSQGPPIWRRIVAAVRYLSYRGFHIRPLRWNSAPVGILLLGAAGTIFFFCMDLAPKPYYWTNLNWGNSPPLGTRSGWMALACMPFIFATASKANWLTLLTGVPHEKLQVFHRWISYAFFVLALLHTFPFIVYHIRNQDMVAQVTQSNILFYWTGIVALIFQAWLTFASFGPFRNLGYEFFKAAHFFGAMVFMLIFFWHCDYTLTSWDYFIATAAVYVPCLVYPWLRTYIEYGSGQRAQIFVEDNGFTRITIPATFDWVPGQHCFLRFRSFGVLNALTSHPFTICSLPATSMDEQSCLTFYIRRRSGFTARLYDHAVKQPGVSVPVFVDGPYGGIDPQKYHSSDRLLVIAGGSGAGWTLPFIEQFVRCVHGANAEPVPSLEARGKVKPLADTERQAQRSPARPLSLRVILATRDTATRVWFHKTVGSLLSANPEFDPSSSSSSSVDVQVYLTGEAEQHADPPDDDLVDPEWSETSSSAEKTVAHQAPGAHRTARIGGQERRGRPPLRALIRAEAAGGAETGQALGVFVCGPDTMQHDVRNAVARENLSVVKGSRAAGSGAYLHLEHFSWA